MERVYCSCIQNVLALFLRGCNHTNLSTEIDYKVNTFFENIKYIYLKAESLILINKRRSAYPRHSSPIF